MCNNSLIYLATPNASTIAQGGVLPLTTIVRRRGKAIQQSNDSIVLNEAGYYRVSVSETFTAPATGIVSLSFRQDGVQIQGATTSTSIATATTEVDSLALDCIVRVGCCNAPSILTFVNSGVAINTSNIAVNVEYLD